MIKNKKFDCVQMKWDIQKRINQEYAHLSDEEAHRIQFARIKKNPTLGSYIKKLHVLKNRKFDFI